MSEVYKAAPEPAKKVDVGPKARASESSDPAIQKLMAELQSAQMNRAALDVEEADAKTADEAVAAAKKNLADLGYE